MRLRFSPANVDCLGNEKSEGESAGDTSPAVGSGIAVGRVGGEALGELMAVSAVRRSVLYKC